MQYGRDEKKQRILPFKGGRSICPLCSGVLIAKCGPIYDWHWQHYKSVNCDNWKEPETLWHLSWKKNWPITLQEVILEKDGKKHIADVQNTNGIVIEFQNSPIAISTISAREEFYGKMLWVINAKNFVDHLNIWSLVTKELKEIEANSRQCLASENYCFDTKMKGYQKELDKLQRSILKTKEQLGSAKFKMESCNKNPDQVGEIAATTFKEWDEINPGYGENNYFSKYTLQPDFQRYRSEKKTSNALAAELFKIETKVNLINDAQLYKAKNIPHILLDYDQIVKLKPSISIAIPKQEQHSMFQFFNDIRSFGQLLSYQQKQGNYLFAADPLPLLNELKEQETNLMVNLQTAKNAQPDYLALIRSRISSYYFQSYELTKKHFDGWQKQLAKEEVEQVELLDDIAHFREMHQLKTKSYVEESEKNLATERVKAMQQYKGKYGFHWKNERKSWSETGCPVFFDIGEDYLFQRIASSTLRKVKLVDFFMKYNSQKNSA